MTHLQRRRIAGSSPQMPVLGQLFVTMHELLPRESSRMHAHSSNSNLLANRETETVNTYVPLALSCRHFFVTPWQLCHMPALSGYLKCTVKRRESENRARSRALLSALNQLREMCWEGMGKVNVALFISPLLVGPFQKFMQAYIHWKASQSLCGVLMLEKMVLRGPFIKTCLQHGYFNLALLHTAAALDCRAMIGWRFLLLNFIRLVSHRSQPPYSDNWQSAKRNSLEEGIATKSQPLCTCSEAFLDSFLWLCLEIKWPLQIPCMWGNVGTLFFGLHCKWSPCFFGPFLWYNVSDCQGFFSFFSSPTLYPPPFFFVLSTVDKHG